jgi:hypothetical protein
MEPKVKKRRDDLLQQYWSYEELPANKIPNSIIGYWKGLFETETHWECKNIISCIIENIIEKKQKGERRI